MPGVCQMNWPFPHGNSSSSLIVYRLTNTMINPLLCLYSYVSLLNATSIRDFINWIKLYSHCKLNYSEKNNQQILLIDPGINLSQLFQYKRLTSRLAKVWSVPLIETKSRQYSWTITSRSNSGSREPNQYHILLLNPSLFLDLPFHFLDSLYRSQNVNTYELST